MSLSLIEKLKRPSFAVASREANEVPLKLLYLVENEIMLPHHMPCSNRLCSHKKCESTALEQP